MHSLKSASALLDATSSASATAPLLRELGFLSEPIRLHPEATRRLGLTDPSRHWHIASGEGALRALTFSLADIDDPRTEMTRIASRLTSTAPHLFWILIGVSEQSGEQSGELVIAAWNQGQSPPRIVALVVHRGRIVDSDCETVCALSASRSQSDILTHCRWLEILGRQSVTRRFFRALQNSVHQLAQSLDPAPPPNCAFELALLYLSRLLFLSFLETKGWLDRDHAFLGNQYADCMARGGRFHARILSPLFFGTLNTHPRNRARRAREFGRIPFLNGGLFTRSILERSTIHASFSDEALGDLFANLLGRYRFTAREDTTAWSEAAIDPEILGKAFESLMGAADRRRTGAFYTPQALVERLSTSALASGLSTPQVARELVAAALRGDIPSARDRTWILSSVDGIRILDPACGSGAFLVHCLETLASLRLRLGDIRPLHVIRRAILTSSIFGVDVNPMAVWLCELRLWLSMAIENPEADPMKVAPLPNLDRHVRVGDSLGGMDFSRRPDIPGARDLAAARERYSRAVGPRKKSLAQLLDRSERACAIAVADGRIAHFQAARRDLLTSIRSRDLFGKRNAPAPDARRQLVTIRQSIAAARRSVAALKRGAALPFSFPTHFADVSAAGGFDVVIGNPPWVRTGNVPRDDRLRLRRSFKVYRESAWRAGADAAAAGRGFAAQVDVAALFVERSVRLARDSGTIALLVPAKLWRSLAGGGVRTFLFEETDMVELHDLTESDQAFDASVYPSLLVATRVRRRAAQQSLMQPVSVRAIATGNLPTVATVERRRELAEWRVDREGIRFDASRGSPWILAPPEVRAAFDTLAYTGTPFAETVIGRPRLGVKTGCNEAFIVVAAVANGERDGT
ncbi:MAG: N-6 DNA methylase, partial [Gemmatimonadaceae bacterium]|nr:N-6 DNA methylase [Gemmatimonadaceae bacterium]